MRSHDVKIEQLENRLIGLRSSRSQLEQAIQREKEAVHMVIARIHEGLSEEHSEEQYRAVEELISSIGSTMSNKVVQRRLPDRISKELKAAILSGLSTELSSRNARSNSDAYPGSRTRSSGKTKSKHPVSIFSNPSILDEEPRELVVTVRCGKCSTLHYHTLFQINSYGFLSQSTYELIDDVDNPLKILSHDEGRIWRLVCGLIASLPSRRDREFALDMCSGDGAWTGVRGALAEYSEFIRNRNGPCSHVESLC